MLERLLNTVPMSRTGLIVVHDVLVVVASLPLVAWLIGPAVFDGARAAYIMATLPILAVASALAAIAVSPQRGVWRYIGNAEIMRAALFVFVALAFSHVGQVFLGHHAPIAPLVPVFQFLLATFLLLASRIAYSEAVRRAKLDTGWAGSRERILLVGSGDGAALFQHLVAHEPQSHYEVVGILANGHGRHRTIGGVSVLGSFAEFDRVLATLRVQDMTPTRVVVTCPHHVLGRAAVYGVMRRAHVHRLPVLQLPDVMRLRHQHWPAEPGDDEAWVGAEERAFYPVLKRGTDAVLAASALLVCAPFLLLIGAMVAATLGRPVFFVQIRPGLGRRPFKLWKFRTMRDPVDEDGRALTDAERTPWFGWLLRRTRLDELPQLWNVLNGDMTLIGPRPLLAADLDRMADGGVARCRIRPGITGWAQVNGGHQLTADEKLALDLWYAEHASLRLDALIVTRTLLMMLWGERRNTEAIASALGHRSPAVIAAE